MLNLMTNQGVQPESSPSCHFAVQCPTKGAEYSVPIFDSRTLPSDHQAVARRRKYIAGLAALLGSLVACALAIGLVEALKARNMRRLVHTQPLNAGISGEGFQPVVIRRCTTCASRLSPAKPNVTQYIGCIGHHTCPVSLLPA